MLWDSLISWPPLALRSRKLFPWETGDSQCQPGSRPGPGDVGAVARNAVPAELQHFGPKASLAQARQSALQMGLLNVFNIAVADREMQSSPSHTSPQVRGDRGYKPVFVSFPGNDQDTGLAAQITRALQGQATVISLCASEAFSVSSPARGTWQEYSSCWAASALEGPSPAGGC